MNTGAFHTPAEHNTTPHSPLFPAVSAAPNDGTALEELIKRSCIASLAPHLYEALHHLVMPETHIIDLLQSNVHALQESFISTLCTYFTEQNINLQHKITLRLDNQSRLYLATQHPEASSILATLQQHPELATAFQEIAKQSAMLRHIYSLHSMLLHIENTDQALPPLAASLQLSVMGDMSHFYFNSIV